MAVGLPEGPSYPGHSPHTNPFFAVLPLNDRRRAARSFFKIGLLSSLFSCFSLARLLILLLVLMSGNAHPNPCLVFPCSVCAGNVTWRGRLLLLFTRPLPRNGGMAEDHGAPEAGQLPRVWTRGHKETKSRQRVSGTKSP